MYRLPACLLVKKYIQEKRNIRMKIDKKLIVSALEIYKAFLVKRDISEHDQTLDIVIKVNEQIKLVKTL
jgi:hypothetical protein